MRFMLLPTVGSGAKPYNRVKFTIVDGVFSEMIVISDNREQMRRAVGLIVYHKKSVPAIIDIIFAFISDLFKAVVTINSNIRNDAL